MLSEFLTVLSKVINFINLIFTIFMQSNETGDQISTRAEC